jgi:hypothetical protein
MKEANIRKEEVEERSERKGIKEGFWLMHGE